MTPKEKFNVIVVLLIVFALGFGLLSMCFSESSQTETEETEEIQNCVYKPGDIVYITDDCYGVVDKDDWDELMKFINAKDKIGVMNFIAAGKGTVFAAGKRVKVIKNSFSLTQIRDIDASENLFWIPNEMLTDKDIYGIYESDTEN